MARQGPGLFNAMGPGAARGDRSRSEQVLELPNDYHLTLAAGSRFALCASSYIVKIFKVIGDREH